MSININDFKEGTIKLLSKISNVDLFGIPLKKIVGASLLAITVSQAVIVADKYNEGMQKDVSFKSEQLYMHYEDVKQDRVSIEAKRKFKEDLANYPILNSNYKDHKLKFPNADPYLLNPYALMDAASNHSLPVLNGDNLGLIIQKMIDLDTNYNKSSAHENYLKVNGLFQLKNGLKIYISSISDQNNPTERSENEFMSQGIDGLGAKISHYVLNDLYGSKNGNHVNHIQKNQLDRVVRFLKNKELSFVDSAIYQILSDFGISGDRIKNLKESMSDIKHVQLDPKDMRFVYNELYSKGDTYSLQDVSYKIVQHELGHALEASDEKYQKSYNQSLVNNIKNLEEINGEIIGDLFASIEVGKWIKDKNSPETSKQKFLELEEAWNNWRMVDVVFIQDLSTDKVITSFDENKSVDHHGTSIPAMVVSDAILNQWESIENVDIDTSMEIGNNMAIEFGHNYNPFTMIQETFSPNSKELVQIMNQIEKYNLMSNKAGAYDVGKSLIEDITFSHYIDKNSERDFINKPDEQNNYTESNPEAIVVVGTVISSVDYAGLDKIILDKMVKSQNKVEDLLKKSSNKKPTSI
jgi:hypothetical protein